MFESFTYQGLNYTYPTSNQEDIGWEYANLARSAYKSNGIVFACILARIQLFAEARFLYRRQRKSRPGDLFGFAGDDLEILRHPWDGGTTGDLLSRMLLHVDLGGNSYVVRDDGMLTPLRPDWVTILGGVPGDEDATVWHPRAKVLGYAYQEGGKALGKDPVFYLPDQVAHFAPLPDPEARFRGMSWLQPVVRDVMADKAMTDHKLLFMERGASRNMVVKLDVPDLKQFEDWTRLFREQHEGVANAYKTIFLGAGADVSVVGADMQQIEFAATQGAGETRIAAAAGVPPAIAGLSEGLQGSSLNAGNYVAVRRRFADMTIRHLWRNVSGSLARIITVPSDAELWYDDRDIAALKEDQKDAATIRQLNSTTAKTLVDSGYDPDSVIAAIAADDLGLLKHTGLVSVQLQPPGTQAAPEAAPADPATPPENGQPPKRGIRELLMSLAPEE
jgi:phage portal protein BeeE